MAEPFDFELLRSGFERLRNSPVTPPPPYVEEMERLHNARARECSARAEVLDAQRYRMQWASERRRRSIGLAVIGVSLVNLVVVGLLLGSLAVVVLSLAAIGWTAFGMGHRKGIRAHTAGTAGDLAARTQDVTNAIKQHERRLNELRAAEAAVPTRLAWPELDLDIDLDPQAKPE